MFCKGCGKKITNSSRYCPYCGIKINHEENKKRKSKLCFKWLIGIICIIGCATLILLNKEFFTGIYEKVLSNGIESDELQFAEHFSEEEYNTYKQLATELADIENQYTDENGYVRAEDVDELWELIKDRVEEEERKGIIEKCEYNENQKTVFIKFSSGIQYMYIPYIEGSLSAGNESRIITMEPSATNYQFLISAFITWIDKEYNDLEYSGSYSVPASAQLIADSNSDYIYDKSSNYNINENVTIERAKTLSEYKIVIWEGHGGYASDVHSVLVTSELDSSYAESYKYAEDMADGSLILAGTGYIQKYALTSKFFDKYLEEMDDTLVFLGGCYTAKDRILADSFLNKGAVAVVGYSASVSMIYEMMTRANFFYALSRDDITLETIKQSVEYAWTHVGLQDPWGKEEAEMYLFFPANSDSHEYSTEQDSNIEKGKSKEEISQYLSILLECNLREYSFENVDYLNLLWVAYRYIYENETYKIEFNEESYDIRESDVNDFIKKYFNILIPCESFDGVIYQDGKFCYSGGDYGNVGRTVAIVEDVSVDNNQYTVTFYDTYIYLEDFTAGKVNPINDWHEYYGYNIEMVSEDEFCQVNGKGTAILEDTGNEIIVKELYITENDAMSNEYIDVISNDVRLVSLIGILCYADDGNLVLKLKNDTIFYSEDGTKYEFDEVGIGDWENSYYEFIDKKILVTGDLFEAHTRYHYRDIMILVDSMTAMNTE